MTLSQQTGVITAQQAFFFFLICSTKGKQL